MPYVSLEASNLPGYFIRHRDYLGEISPIDIKSEFDPKDATFAVPDWARIGSVVMLRSVNYPLHVLRHQDQRLKLHEYNPGLYPAPELGHRDETPEERQLRADASFVLVRGLADSNALSFRSLNYEHRFIRHRDFHLYVEELDGRDSARKEATFNLKDAFFIPPPMIVE